MGRDALVLVDNQKLEDLIVEAFKMYEKGLWPYVMRQEAKNIINAAKVENSS